MLPRGVAFWAKDIKPLGWTPPLGCRNNSLVPPWSPDSPHVHWQYVNIRVENWGAFIFLRSSTTSSKKAKGAYWNSLVYLLERIRSPKNQGFLVLSLLTVPSHPKIRRS